MIRTFVVALLTISAWSLMGCMAATSPKSDPKTTPSPQTSAGSGLIRDGYFIDGPTGGLAYQTSSGRKGTTDADGRYTYADGDTVQFLLGGQVLGSAVVAAKTISPLTLFGAAKLDESTGGIQAGRLIRLLMSLDDGTNPFGLTISTAVETDLVGSDVDLGDLLASSNFEADAQVLVKDVLGAGAVLADLVQAKSHWEISKQLAEELNQVTDDTLVLAVRIPDGYVGGSLLLSYQAAAPPPGATSYQSGQYHSIASNDNGIVVFRGKLHSEHWQLTLSLLQANSGVQEGDLLSFFHGEGFSQTLPSGYDLDLTSGRRVLQADLSSGEAIRIAKVHEVSGHLVVAKALPDGTSDWAATEFMTEFSIFNALVNDDANAAHFSVRLSLGDSAQWTGRTIDDIECYSIPFSTTLPSGYEYSLQSYYRTTYPGGYETFSWDSIELLNEAVTDIELIDTTWSVPSS